jgi:hypothetical protein
MDAASYCALGLALDRDASVLQDTMLALERQRMLTEDIAAQALTGRLTHNYLLQRSHVNSWEHEYRLLSQALDEQQERARLAMQRVNAIGAAPEFRDMLVETQDLLDFEIPMDLDDVQDLDDSDAESDP